MGGSAGLTPSHQTQQYLIGSEGLIGSVSRVYGPGRPVAATVAWYRDPHYHLD